MKRFVLGAIVLLATGTTAKVRAADLPYPPPPPRPYPPIAYPHTGRLSTYCRLL